MKYKISNWEKFQHYKDRCPPWIKLHFEILMSHDWVMVSDASKLLAVVCMLLASRGEGTFDGDVDYIKRAANLHNTPCFKELISIGFIKPLADASTKAQAVAIIEKRREETETEKKSFAFAQDNTPFFLASMLLNLIRQRNPSHKQPDMQAWSLEMDRIIRIDCRKEADVVAVINWCQQDDFWRNNILSPSKLRKQFDQLFLKMNEKTRHPKSEIRNMLERGLV